MARTVAGFNKLDSVLPPYNLKRNNEKMSHFNLLHYGANYTKLLLLAMEYKIEKDSDTFRKGVDFLKLAFDSRWTNDLFVNNTIEDLFKSTSVSVPQHDSSCDSGSNLDTSAKHFVTGATHPMQNDSLPAPVINDTATASFVLEATHQTENGSMCTSIIPNMPAVHHIADAKQQTQEQPNNLEVAHDSHQPLIFTSNNNSSSFNIEELPPSNDSNVMHLPGTDQSQNVTSTDHPCLFETSAIDPQASCSDLGPIQPTASNIIYQAFMSSQNAPDSPVQTEYEESSNKAQFQPLVQLITHDSTSNSPIPTSSSEAARVDSLNEIAEFSDSNCNNKSIMSTTSSSSSPSTSNDDITTGSASTHVSDTTRKQTVAFPRNVSLGDCGQNNKENNVIQDLTHRSVNESFPLMENNQIENIRAVGSDFKTNLSVRYCNQQNALIASHNSNVRMPLNETVHQNVVGNTENNRHSGSSQDFSKSKMTLHGRTPEEQFADLPVENVTLGQDSNNSDLGNQLNTPVKKGRKIWSESFHGQPLSNPGSPPLVCIEHDEDMDFPAIISFCMNSY